jgi:hypothetical protein
MNYNPIKKYKRCAFCHVILKPSDSVTRGVKKKVNRLEFENKECEHIFHSPCLDILEEEIQKKS